MIHMPNPHLSRFISNPKLFRLVYSLPFGVNMATWIPELNGGVNSFVGNMIARNFRAFPASLYWDWLKGKFTGNLYIFDGKKPWFHIWIPVDSPFILLKTPPLHYQRLIPWPQPPWSPVVGLGSHSLGRPRGLPWEPSGQGCAAVRRLLGPGAVGHPSAITLVLQVD